MAVAIRDEMKTRGATLVAEGGGGYARWVHRAGGVECDIVGAGVGGCRADARVLMQVWSQEPTAAFGV